MSEDRLTVAAEPRTITGKKVKQLRRNGVVPAVIYGRNESVNIQLEDKSLYRVLRQTGSTQLLDIKLLDARHTVLAREIQQHVTRGDLIHVDFFEVNMSQTITSEAALMLVGVAGEEAQGMGTVVLATQSVEIECLPGDLISEIEVDRARIETPDDVLYVSDLTAPKGVTILTDSGKVIARFEYMQTEEEVEAEELEETSVEDVEVIEKGKEEEEEE